MPKKRIETTTSRTAEWTCLCRAVSSLETDSHYRSDDHIARSLLPRYLAPMLHVALVRRLYRALSPKGIYEYVIARTKYVDAVFNQALAEQFDQILIFGAGFDTRGLRFKDEARKTRIFELDAPLTQQAKLRQYQDRHLDVPPNLVFIAIDFDRESVSFKLNECGFGKARRSLFVLEGLLMYLQPESVDATFRTIQDYAAPQSWVIFDYVYASVLRNENLYYGESQVLASVSRADEQWHFGIERGKVEQFLSTYGLKLRDHKDARELERAYFTTPSGRIVGRVNGAHCLVTAEKR